MRRATGVGALLLVLLGPVVGCGSNDTRLLKNLEMGIHQRWLVALAEYDLEHFNAFVATEGADFTLATELFLFNALNVSSFDEFERSHKVLMPRIDRTLEALAKNFGFDLYFSTFRRFAELSTQDAFECLRDFRQAHRYSLDASVAVEERVRALDSVCERFRAKNIPLSTAYLYLRLAELEGGRGDLAAQRRWLDLSIADNERFGAFHITCNALGVRGALSGAERDTLSMLRDWNEGLQIAVEHRLPEQSARLLNFLASHYKNLGRTALAHRLRLQGDEYMRDWGGSPYGIRFLIRELSINADMGCWDLVERDLRAAEKEIQIYAEVGEPNHVRKVQARIQGIRARTWLAQGRSEKAHKAFEEAESELSELGFRGYLYSLRRSWTRDLRFEDEPAGVIEVVNRALDDHSNDTEVLAFLVEAAHAHAELADWASSERRLDEASDIAILASASLGESRLIYDAVRIRAAVARGSIEEALQASKIACENLDDWLHTIDANQEGRLALRKAQPLRDVFHEIIGSQSVLEYEFEFHWRRLSNLLGGVVFDDNRQHTSGLDPLGVCLEIVEVALLNKESGSDYEHTAVQSRSNDLHLLYHARSDSLIRWRSQASTLERHAEPIGEVDLLARTHAVLRLVEQQGANTSTVVGPNDLRVALHELAKLVLPQDVFSAEPLELSARSPRTIHLSADGGLRAIPFGILNLSEHEYVPLVSFYDIEYVGPSVNDVVNPKPGSKLPGIIVAGPRLRPETKGWPDAAATLDHAIQEARALRALRPKSLLLEEACATKRTLMDNWKDASFLYFAAHVVQDPQAGYLSYLPLAPPAGTAAYAKHSDADVLDTVDIRSVRFDNAPVVVLSACSSGAPYLVRGAEAPGLGDAFLLSGASTVIQTLWSVRDDVSSSLMRRTIHDWTEMGMPPSTALNRACRQMSRVGEFSHPYYWGSFIASSNSAR